ncbi:hypothetical protein Nepgr_032711 [Nepenthes gracilis]|uniref:Pectinesterase inhibitor domain-containing protein n=1 Tax=Nepenthes gracilis TaxID=150966 RepID=A0AAD3Y6A2_NEPGR|nr:hypothetical protein Nepgr_032711 [Nepenthes gracilis]
MSGSSKAALSDCVEVVQDALDNAHRSLDTLRNLNVGEFEFQMSDVLTWLSAALTDEDTCMDGFEGLVGRQVKMIHDKVQNVSYVTSNALALANWLATSGVQALSGP